MKNRRLKLVFNVDRPHIAYEILSVLEENDVEVKDMEVYTYVIYLKIPFIPKEIYNKILNEWYQIKDLKHIEEVDLISFEKKDLEMKKVIDLIPSGIIIINNEGSIEYANKFCAERIFNRPSKVLENDNFFEIISKESNKETLINKLSSEPVRNKEIQINNTDYLADSTPILVDSDVVIGHIISINEYVNLDLFRNSISFSDIITENKIMTRIVRKLKKLSNDKEPIFIIGEKGLGKELLARSVHNYGDRQDSPFVSIRCGTKPNKLLEIDLFGSVKYSGKNYRVEKSIFEIADGGVVFFDEISKLSPNIQSKLIKVIREKRIFLEQLGVYRPIDVRILASSSKSLNELKNNNCMNKGLFEVFKENLIIVPPLRDRKEDIPILSKEFIKEQSKTSNTLSMNIDKEAEEILYKYDWPGNIRELQNVLGRAMELSNDYNITKKEITKIIQKDPFKNQSLTDIVNQYERKLIVEALKKNDSIRGTSRYLKVTHTLLLNRINKYEIQESEWIS